MVSDSKQPSVGPALITGGGGTIGAEIACALARSGATVVVADLDTAAAAATADRVQRAAGSGFALELDVASANSWRTTHDRAVREFGPLSTLVNAAGIEGAIAPIGDYPLDVFDAVLAVNVRGTFLGLATVLPSMQRAGLGSVVNISSTAGLLGLAHLAGYVASKHAVLGLTRTAAVEAAHHGVRVNAVCPGPTAGRMMDVITTKLDPSEAERVKARYIRAIPMRRYAEPSEVASVVTFLASDGAMYVNGAVWTVDGGMSTL